MTDNLKKLLEAASRDAQLKEKLTAAPTVEEVIAIAKEQGIELTEEDIKKPEAEELSDDALEQTAGGVHINCFCAAFGGGESDYADLHACGCVGYGQGDTLAGDTNCVCVTAGAGHDYQIEEEKRIASLPVWERKKYKDWCHYIGD